MADALKGIEYDKVCDWLASSAADTLAPYHFDLIAAGGSNLTYKVTDDNGKVFILRRPPAGGQIATAHAECQAATESLVDIQIAFHTADLEAIGLADLGKHTGYVERQLKRWKKQVEASTTRELPLLNELYETFSATIPAEKNRPGLAHRVVPYSTSQAGLG